MYINLLNRKTGKAERIDINKSIPLQEVKQIGAAAAASAAHYFIAVIAETEEEIDFINSSFTNIPVPIFGVKHAIWTGDLAIFIILNYPAAT